MAELRYLLNLLMVVPNCQVEEVLVEGARAAAERGDLAQFETLMIRANRPREVVQHYKDLGKHNTDAYIVQSKPRQA